MIDFLRATAAESERFNQALQTIWAGPTDPATVPVPTCAGWNAADLAYHLSEVQYFWAEVVGRNLSHYKEAESLVRPPDAELVALHNNTARRLVEVLADRRPDQPCWSWHPQGGNIGWVLRRQAHEALIHRVDAESSAETVEAGSTNPVDEALAADGIDEILAVLLDVGEPPQDTIFKAEGSISIEVPSRAWHLNLGTLVADGPAAADQDLPAIQLVDRLPETSAVVRGSASEIDLWLWRRGPLRQATVDGSPEVVARLPEISRIA